MTPKLAFSIPALIALTGQAVAAPHAAVAQHAGPESEVMFFTLMQFAMSLLAFAIVFFILSKIVWPKILGGLEEREKKIRSEVFAAEEARKRATDAMKEYEKSLSEARAEARAMIERTKAEQARLAADLRARAEAELTQLREQARASIAAAKRAAITELHAEAASLAVAVATKILQREVTIDDQRRLVDESVGEFSSQFAPA